MTITRQIEAVYQRAALLHQCATESPVQLYQLDAAMQELNFVLEELQTSEDELRQQNQLLIATREQVEAEKKRYQELFHLAPNGYLVTDNRGVIQEANAAIAQLLNVSHTYLIGKPISVFISESDRPALYTALKHVNQSSPQEPQTSPNWDIQIPSRQSSSRSVSIKISTTYDANGAVLRLLWMLHDITPQKQLNQLLENLNAELEYQVQERTLASTKAQEQAEAANRSKSELLSTISYELRTSLNAILGMSELLQSESTGPLNDLQKRAIATVENSGNHLLALLDTI